MWTYNYSTELYHYGIKGMRWGHRKARPISVGNRNRTKSDESQQKHDKRTPMSTKKKVAIGAAVVGTALAAYGGYKLKNVVRDKNFNLRLKQAEQYIDGYRKSGRFDKYIGMPTKDLIEADRGYSKLVHETFDHYVNKAKTDSFGTAFKNVAKDEIAKRKRR